MSALRSALAVPFTLLLPLTAQSTNLFGAPVVVPLSAPPGQVEDMELLGDIDNDGDVDVLAFTRANNNLGRTSFRPLRNDGTGNFVPGTAVSIAPDVASVMCVGDVDADGFLDVITRSALNPAGPGLLVFRSLGGTGWAAPLHVPLPGSPWVLGTGHANGDGVADVFVLHSAGSNLEALWLLGGPAATFPVGPTVSFGSSSTFDGALLDMDGDGLTDFAAVTDLGPGQSIGLYHTTPAGLVLSSTLLLTSSGDATIVAADMDGDGDTDLQTAWRQSSSTHFRLLRNDGPAGITALASHAVASPQFFGLRAVDWDGDGDRDLLARDGGVGGGGPVGYGITLLENVSGVFTHRRRDAFPENTLGRGAGAADLDGDGHPDYVEPHTLVFGTGTFVLPPAVAIDAPDDWDGDGDLDDTGRTNDGRGVLTAIAGFMPPPPANLAYRAHVATGDFDGDGLREVIAPLHQALFPGAFVEMRRLEANGDGQLVDVGVTAVTGGGLVIDTDSDGDLDIFSSQGVWQNGGSGTFTLVPFAVAGFAPGATGDLDNDSDQDFVGTLGSQTVVLLRTGLGTFATTTLPVPPGALAMVITASPLADLDDDGDLDILCVAVTPTLAQLTVVFANTGGAFTALPLLPFGGRLMPGDVDGDGMTDLCVQDPQRLHVLRRVGPGIAYGPPTTYIWRDTHVAADLEQDGDLDLLGASTLRNRRFQMPAAGERRQYGTGGAGSGGRRPLLSLLGPLRAGLTTSARLVAAPGGSAGVLFVSTVEANVPNALPGVTSWIGPSFPALAATFGGAPGQPGAGSVDIPIVIPPGVNGTQLFLQFVVLDPAMPIGLGYSNGCELFVGL